MLNYTAVKQKELTATKRSASMDAGAVSIVLEALGLSVPDTREIDAFTKEEGESDNSSDEEEAKDATKKLTLTLTLALALTLTLTLTPNPNPNPNQVGLHRRLHGGGQDPCDAG